MVVWDLWSITTRLRGGTRGQGLAIGEIDKKNVNPMIIMHPNCMTLVILTGCNFEDNSELRLRDTVCSLIFM